MSRAPVVAELGRPETPEETAARKAASSKAYRSSQTVRNLVAAMLATLAVVVIIVFAVPRGTLTPPAPIDLDTVAAQAADAIQRPVLTPALGEQWHLNSAELVGGPITVWNIVLAPAAETDRGFARIAQAFDADSAWAPQRLGGIAPTGTVTVTGAVWDEFVPRSPESSGNISYALGRQVGSDYVLVYGALAAEAMQALAASLSDELDRIARTR